MLSWPLLDPDAPITCDYDCHLRRKSKAPGLDIVGARYALVLACADGKVTRSRTTNRAGRSLWIDHGQGTKGFYSHLAIATVLEGEWVSRGQMIGVVGASGLDAGEEPHLHLGLKFMGEWVDPERVLAR